MISKAMKMIMAMIYEGNVNDYDDDTFALD